MTSETTRSTSQPATLARGPAAMPGRLATLALLGGFAGALPLPLVPAALLRRVRGVVVHEVASRHGLSLTDEARAALADPPEGTPRGALLSTVFFAVRRIVGRLGALGALGVLPPLAAWGEVASLGLLLDHYFANVRPVGLVRVDAVEAKRVRSAIDDAVARALSPSLDVPAAPAQAEAPEDLRDDATRLTDTVLLAVASVPSHARRRLEAAFDAVAGRAGLGRDG